MAEKQSPLWERALHLGATILTLLTAPWVVLLGAGLAVVTVMLSATFKFVSDPHVQRGVEVFLVLLWTYIGLRFLESLNKTSIVKMVADYRYAINPEG
jgi:hypothetical protein